MVTNIGYCLTYALFLCFFSIFLLFYTPIKSIEPKGSIIPIKKIIEFRENIKKLKINEDSILKYEIEKGYVVDIPKLIFEICAKAEEIKIIKHMEDNLMLFI